MSPERWQQIGRILKGALERTGQERASYLRQECAGDNELRREVEALLSSNEQTGSFTEAMPFTLAGLREPVSMVGSTFHHAADPFLGRIVSNYRLEERLAAGGMGVLYRATDLRLGRSVAVKVLSRQLAPDETAKARFLREARTASALDHPNIGAIYHIEEQDGELFIVMALYQGETFKQRLQKGPLPVSEALELLRQVALGLDAAHRARIVHRDIKPANLLRTDEGVVKILDFGLAKLTSESQATAVTQTGETMGTVLYMSPEQLRGGAVDGRSDLWSFGVVAYELLAGVSPFQAGSGAAIAGRILSEEPPALASVPGVPAWLAELVTQLLRKLPAQRVQSASEVLARLDRPSSPIRSRTKLRRASFALAVIALVALLASFAGLNPGAWRDRLFAKSGGADIRSLAVLPMGNLSGDSQQEYFADGITDALIDNLGKIGSLRVTSRTSAMQFKATRKTLPEIARDLSVDAVVEGAVLRSGNRVRITAQLIRVAPEKRLWAHTYDRDLKDVLALQDEIARAIAQEVKLKLSAQESANVRPVNPEAQEDYLRGLYYWGRRPLGLEKAIESFQQALDKDPNYAPAYAGLAYAYATMGSWENGILAPREAMPKAKAAALKALEIDDTVSDAHASLAYVRMHYDWQWPASEEEFKRSIELNPSNAIAHHWYSHYLTAMGRNEESLAETKRAQELDPLDPVISIHLAWLYYNSHQFDSVIEQCVKVLKLEPKSFWPHFNLGWAYEQKQMFSEAIAEFEKTREMAPSQTHAVAGLAHAYAAAGKRIEALQVLNELQAMSKRGYVSSFDVAIVYMGLGDHPKTLEWLDKAYAERSGWLVYLNQDPKFDGLRSDGRFQELLRRIGLAP